LRTELNTGDQVEIITDKNSKPSPLWIRFLKTSSARQKVRQYFRRQQEELSKAFHITTETHTEIEKEIPKITPKSKKKNPNKEVPSILVAGQKDILTHIAKCCAPLPGDEIVGFITRGRGVTIHKKDCEQTKKFADTSKKIPVAWLSSTQPIPVDIEVRAYDRPKIYAEIVSAISSTDTNMLGAGASTNDQGIVIAKFTLQIEHQDQLQEIIDNIKRIPNVISAEKKKIDYSVLGFEKHHENQGSMLHKSS
jgi:GTP pyrophosphokinase